ncbi:hypothetical protein [Kitasatospora sp. NPDC088346]|uniref:hypothetical protein n=1 Tax=Kitasatospora sp. NPDC088346 TaxID=3364073 RepID=UPI00380F43C5
MTERDDSTGRVPGPRHAAPRSGVGSRLRGRALAIAAVPTVLLVGAYAPTLAMADSKTDKACASAPDTVIEETPVPQSEIKITPGTDPAGKSATTKSTTKATTQPATQAAAKVPAQQSAAARTDPAVYTTSTGGHSVQTSGAQTSGVQQAGLIDDIVDGIFHPNAAKSATPTASPVPPAPRTETSTAPTGPSSPAAPSGAASPAPAPSAPTAAAPSASAAAGSKAPVAKGKAATPSPTPSASASAGPNCVLDTRDVAAKAAGPGHVVPEQNWTLKSSRLALHGSVFNGVYDVKTPTGTKRVLKFTTASVDIGNLDMSTIEIPGLTFHVKSAPNSTSTMRNGPITMYVERLSGHLAEIYGLPIPIDLGEITLTPDTLPKWLWDLLSGVPIPLDITLNNATAVQAGQFGGTLKIPGMKLYNDETPYEN